MYRPPEKEPVTVVTACMRPDGTPTFTMHTVGVTAEELSDGLHYGLVEMQLHKGGYQEPFVHFAENESPDFLHPAVRRYLGPASAHTTVLRVLSEGKR